jgi:hypothetical protein
MVTPPMSSSSDTVAVVINSCYGGFSLSTEGWDAYVRLGGGDRLGPDGCDIPRADPKLVQVVRTLGARANGRSAKLEIEEVARGRRYRIREYDGGEWLEYEDEVEWTTAGEEDLLT